MCHLGRRCSHMCRALALQAQICVTGTGMAASPGPVAGGARQLWAQGAALRSSQQRRVHAGTDPYCVSLWHLQPSSGGWESLGYDAPALQAHFSGRDGGDGSQTE